MLQFSPDLYERYAAALRNYLSKKPFCRDIFLKKRKIEIFSLWNGTPYPVTTDIVQYLNILISVTFARRVNFQFYEKRNFYVDRKLFAALFCEVITKSNKKVEIKLFDEKITLSFTGDMSRSLKMLIYKLDGFYISLKDTRLINIPLKKSEESPIPLTEDSLHFINDFFVKDTFL